VALTFLACRIAPLADGTLAPLRDARVRRALARAIDRPALVQGAPGETEPAWQLAVRGVRGFDPGRAQEAPDPDAARRLLAEAGAEDLSVRLLASTRGRWAATGLAAQAARAGIRMQVDVRPWPEIYKAMSAGQAPLALASWTMGTGDTSSLFEPVLHSPGGPEGLGLENTTGYADPEMDAQIVTAAREMDPAKRLGLLTGLMRKALDDLPLIPLYSLRWPYGLGQGSTFEPRLDLSIFAADVKPAAPP
jgi:peptide/nickel transport system substrate-binding protein